MFTGKSIWVILQAGGFTMYILLLCSVISLAVMLERFIYYRKRSRIRRGEFMDKIRGEVLKNKISYALTICLSTDTPFSRVAHAGLLLHGHNEKTISQAMEREITIETIKLERYTSIVGTIGSTAVYIGLFGTVLGIIRAFHDISLASSGGINVVIAGISEALICTATGLAVAIPAVIGYNFFIRKIDNFVADMEVCASELMDVIYTEQK
jgi:biopolymer transport protein ExbB